MNLLLLLFLVGRHGLALIRVQIVRWKLTVKSPLTVNSSLTPGNGLLGDGQLFDVFDGQLGIGSWWDPIQRTLWSTVFSI